MSSLNARYDKIKLALEHIISSLAFIILKYQQIEKFDYSLAKTTRRKIFSLSYHLLFN